MLNEDLTIVSVVYNSVDYLNLNYTLLKDNNPDIHNVRWIVVNNGEDEIGKRFDVIPGVERPPKQNQVASIHHAAALNKTLPYLNTTKYVLFLDCDFFLIPPLELLLDNMEVKKLDFFGATYAYRRHRTPVQNFPICFCLLVNTERIDVQSLDFSLVGRDSVEESDTGYKIYEKYKDSNYESVYCHMPNGVLLMDDYVWRGQKFGYHIRAKTHFKGSPAKTKKRDERHKKIFERLPKIVKKAKNDKWRSPKKLRNIKRITPQEKDKVVRLYKSNKHLVPDLASMLGTSNEAIRLILRKGGGYE